MDMTALVDDFMKESNVEYVGLWERLMLLLYSLDCFQPIVAGSSVPNSLQ